MSMQYLVTHMVNGKFRCPFCEEYVRPWQQNPMMTHISDHIADCFQTLAVKQDPKAEDFHFCELNHLIHKKDADQHLICAAIGRSTIDESFVELCKQWYVFPYATRGREMTTMDMCNSGEYEALFDDNTTIEKAFDQAKVFFKKQIYEFIQAIYKACLESEDLKIKSSAYLFQNLCPKTLSAKKQVFEDSSQYNQRLAVLTMFDIMPQRDALLESTIPITAPDAGPDRVGLARVIDIPREQKKRRLAEQHQQQQRQRQQPQNSDGPLLALLVRKKESGAQATPIITGTQTDVTSLL